MVSPHPSVGAIEYATIGTYLLLMIVVGARFQRFNRNVSDYFRSGSRGAWWLVGTSAFMSSFSAWTFTGGAGVAFEAGWSVLIIPLSTAAGGLVNVLWTAPWFRQLRATTGPEVIRMRYGPVTQQFYALCNLGIGVLQGALHLFGIAIFCSAAFGFPIRWVIVVIGIVILLYCTTGGSWAVMATDFLQGLILLPITLLIAWLALRAVGGWSGLHAAIAAQGLESTFQLAKAPGLTAAGAFTWGWVAGLTVKNVVTWNTLASASRYFAVKDGRDARKAALIVTLGSAAGSVLWYLPPMVARLLYASQVRAFHLEKPAEAAYAVASLNLLPAGLIGLVIVAMLTSTMSSVSYSLNHLAAIVIKDVYPAACRVLGRHPRPETQMLAGSRGASLGLGGLIVVLALYYSVQKGVGVFEQMLSLGAYLGTPMAVPMFLGLFVRRVPAWTAMASMGSSLAASAYAGISPLLGGPKWNFQEVVFLTAGVGAGTFFLCRPFWSGVSTEYRRQVAGFFEKMHTPVDFAREVGGSSDLSQLKITGALAVAAGTLVLVLLGFASGASAHRQVLFVAGTLLAVGTLMWIAGGRKPSRGE